MNSERLYEILKDTTCVYRKGPQVEERQVGDVDVVEIFGYDHTSDSPSDDYHKKVDMIFVDVVVDKQKANENKRELEALLEEYPDLERLAEGPSYIELAPNLGLDQEGALRLIALGDALGMWKVMSGKTLGLGYREALELAGHGLLMISGYRPGGKK